MEKLIELKKEVLINFRNHPVLTFFSLLCTVYITSLLILAIILTISPQSEIGQSLENFFTNIQNQLSQ